MNTLAWPLRPYLYLVFYTVGRGQKDVSRMRHGQHEIRAWTVVDRE